MRIQGYNRVIYCRACRKRFVVSNKDFVSNYCKECQKRYEKEISKK
jgi:hypothetical protein